ncbi:superoxide dismutase [Vibrio cholerae]|nr:superoxide dismutase [Vibrio cholerae]
MLCLSLVVMRCQPLRRALSLIRLSEIRNIYVRFFQQARPKDK